MESHLELKDGEIVVLTGPPGAGKSTVASHLVDQFCLSVHLVADTFYHFLSSGSIPPYLPSAQHQNRIVTDVIAQAACGYARGGYTVIYDGILGPWFLPGLLHTAKNHTIPVHYIVLRPNQDTTLTRAQQRRDPTALTSQEPLQTMYSQFMDLGSWESSVIDNSTLSVQETVSTIMTGLSHHTYRCPTT